MTTSLPSCQIGRLIIVEEFRTHDGRPLSLPGIIVSAAEPDRMFDFWAIVQTARGQRHAMVRHLRGDRFAIMQVMAEPDTDYAPDAMLRDMIRDR